MLTRLVYQLDQERVPKATLSGIGRFDDSKFGWTCTDWGLEGRLDTGSTTTLPVQSTLYRNQPSDLQYDLHSPDIVRPLQCTITLIPSLSRSTRGLLDRLHGLYGTHRLRLLW